MNGNQDFLFEKFSKERCRNSSSISARMDQINMLFFQYFFPCSKGISDEIFSICSGSDNGEIFIGFLLWKFRIEMRSK